MESKDMSVPAFPTLVDWEPTRQTLHWYSRGITAVPRAHAEPHPKWWHVSLSVVPDGMVTSKTRLDDGRSLWFKMDLVQHKIIALINEEVIREFSLFDSLSSTQFADQILAIAASFGLDGNYDRKQFENDDVRLYNPVAAEKFLTALVNADQIFKEHREQLGGETSPVQLWPHGFDISLEWFGTRVEIYDDVEYPSQLNLGFFPGGSDADQYFYSNPWPFEGEILLSKSLPRGAAWHTEGWEGTVLPYNELADDDQAKDRLQEYARTVFELCSPTLLAENN
jgi:hypothetical protein